MECADVNAEVSPKQAGDLLHLDRAALAQATSRLSGRDMARLPC